MTFWRDKTLQQMTDAEWESLCDGCALCCLIKLTDDETEEVHYTAIVCDLLDQDRCRCTHYPERHELVSDCIELDAATADRLTWLPKTCAYRLVAEGKDLWPWHHLKSGNRNSVHEAGISVRGRVIGRQHVHVEDEPNYIVKWVET